jgi:proteasome lid subunit RPN8/RPN11
VTEARPGPRARRAGTLPTRRAGAPPAFVAPTGPDAPALPGRERAILPAAIRDAAVAHARAELPNEACGLVAGTAPAAEGGRATTWHPTRNRAASPLRYDVHPDDLLRVSLAIDDAGDVLWGIVHSHVRTAAVPSPTDVARACYPQALHLVVSLAAGEADPVTGAESVRAWRILGGVTSEVALDVAPRDSAR